MTVYIRPAICVPVSEWTEVAPGCWAKRVPESAVPHVAPWIESACRVVDAMAAHREREISGQALLRRK